MAMTPVCWPLTTDGELHMMVMRCTMMSFQIKEKSWTALGIMNHTPHIVVALDWVTMVVPTTVVSHPDSQLYILVMCISQARIEKVLGLPLPGRYIRQAFTGIDHRPNTSPSRLPGTNHNQVAQL